MTADPDTEEAQRRVMQAAHEPYFVPVFEGHWIGALLFCATLVGAAMLYTFLPAAVAVVAGAAADRRAAGTFLALYGAMAALPVGGWALWGLRRRWTALAVAGLFAICAAWLSQAVIT